MTTIDHIILQVNDLAESEKFYCEIMGFSNEGQDGPFTVLRVGPTFTLQLAPWGTSGNGHYAFAMSKARFDEIFARIRALGAAYGGQFDEVGQNTGPGRDAGARGLGTTLYFFDPNRNLVEIRYYADA